MRRAWPAVPVALLLGGSLYALLAAIRLQDPADTDPWLAAWRAAGVQAQLRATSTRPEEHFQIAPLRRRLKEFPDLLLRNYTLHGVRAQIVEFPSEAVNRRLFEDLFEKPADSAAGRHDTAGEVLSARGRWLFVLARRRGVLWQSYVLTDEILERARAAFERTAERLP